MQQIIQSLQQDSGLKPEQAPETMRVVPASSAEPSQDKQPADRPARGGSPQDYTIQEDMQGLTGNLGGLFGM